MKKVWKSIAVILAVALFATGGYFYLDKRPFTPKKVKKGFKNIPYETMKTDEFYHDYLKPLMLQMGFKEEGASYKETKTDVRHEQYSDGSLNQHEAKSSGTFAIPNSRYVLNYTCQIEWVSEGDHERGCYGHLAASYYRLGFYITKKDYSRQYAEVEVYTDFAGFSYKDILKGSYTGVDPTAYIFDEEHNTWEIYNKVQELFAMPEVKELLLVEQQAKSF